MPPKNLQDLIQEQLKYTEKDFFFGDYLKKYNTKFPTEIVGSDSVFNLTAGRSALNTAVICDMLNKGHSLEDILDDNKLKDDRIESAKSVSEHYISGNEADRQWFCDTYTNGCERFLEFMDKKVPPVISEGPNAIFKNENKILLSAVALSKDISQEMVRFTDLYESKNGVGSMKALKDRKEYACTPFDCTIEMISEMKAYYGCNRKDAAKAKRESIVSRYAAVLECTKQYNELLDKNPGVKVQNLNCISVAETDTMMKYFLSGDSFASKMKGVIMDSNVNQIVSDILDGSFASEIGMRVEKNEAGIYSLSLDKVKEYTDKYPAYKVVSEEEKAYFTELDTRTNEILGVIKNTAEGFIRGGDYAPADPKGAMEMIFSEYFRLIDNKTLGDDLRFKDDFTSQLNLLKDESGAAEIRKSPAFRAFIDKMTPEKFTAIMKDGVPNPDELTLLCGQYHNEVDKYKAMIQKREMEEKRNEKFRKEKLANVREIMNEDAKAMKAVAEGLKDNAGDNAIADPSGAKKRIISMMFAHQAIEQAIAKTPDVSVIDGILSAETMDKAVHDMEKSPKMDEFIKNKITDEVFIKLSENPEKVKDAFKDFLDTLKPSVSEKNNIRQADKADEIGAQELGNENAL